MERVCAYIDGFNLYFGIKSSGWRHLYWLNVRLLCQSLLKPGQELVFTSYFTSRVGQPEEKRKRQETFLSALGTLSDFRIFLGKYQLNRRVCPRCRFEDRIPNEKMTDVNIAVEMMSDAFQDKYDTALLISADSDLRSPVTTVRRLFPQKKVVVAFPPNRVSTELKSVASAYIHIGHDKLRHSLFPSRIQLASGNVIERPARWH